MNSVTLMKEFVEFELHKSLLWLPSSSYFKNFFQGQMGPQNRSKMRQRISWLANELRNCFRETAVYLSAYHAISSIGWLEDHVQNLKLNCSHANPTFVSEEGGQGGYI